MKDACENGRGLVAANFFDRIQTMTQLRLTRPMAWLLVSLLLLVVLSACDTNTSSLFSGSRTKLLGTERAADPLSAAEAYMRQYQPGPLPRVFQTTRIYDRKGYLIGETFGEGRRIWVGIDRIAQPLIDATIAVEDATFYTNPGVDAKRIVGAALQNLEEGEVVSGASTITMQLARNLFLGPDQRYDQTVDRKVLEAGLAQELTELYSKAEILEMYLNLLNYGQLAYGPEAAAQVYFRKSAADLTMAEATLLAGIPQQPANLNPYQNWEGARARQRVVLDLMVRHGVLTEAEADAVFAEPPQLAGEPGLAPNLAPHFVQYVIEQLDKELDPGYTRRAGFQVMTTLDLALQQTAQSVVAAQVAELQPVFDLSNAALVALKPGEAEVLVMVGSADFTNEAIAGQVNVAVRPRQPGSAIKPVLIAAALERNLISPASVVWDVPVTYTVGLPQNVANAGSAQDALVYRPRNYDETFHGPVTVRTALANSYNVPMVKLLDRLGVPNMLQTARAMGLHSLTQSDEWYGLSLTLGGGEVTLLDLTTAYHTLANGGIYQPPKVVLELRDSRGTPIPAEESEALAASAVLTETVPADAASTDTALPDGTAQPGDQVLARDTAFLVTDILADNRARLPAFGEGNALQLSLPAAAKTGTTSDYRDNWTVGYTRYLVTGVWAGNSDGRPMSNASGVTGAAPIWHEFMARVLADPDLLARIDAPQDPNAWTFTPPEGLPYLVDTCPPTLTCRSGNGGSGNGGSGNGAGAGNTSDTGAPTGEFFRASWLEAQDDKGPLGDSVVRVPSALVYVQQGDAARRVGLCGFADGAVRSALLLPGLVPQDVGQPGEAGPDAGNQTIAASAANGAANEAADTAAHAAEGENAAAAPQLTPAQQQALAWAIRHATPAYLGPCDMLNVLLPAALALEPQPEDEAMRVLVDLAAAGDPNAATVSADAVPVDAIQRAVSVDGLSGGGVYALAQPIVNDGACPGSYVMGQVLNRDGAPVAGVRLSLRDPWGNEAITVSKNGPNDYGKFDFPIYADGPHDLFLTVLDENNNPISTTFVIPHKQDANSDTPCHHVVLRGG